MIMGDVTEHPAQRLLSSSRAVTSGNAPNLAMAHAGLESAEGLAAASSVGGKRRPLYVS